METKQYFSKSKQMFYFISSMDNTPDDLVEVSDDDIPSLTAAIVERDWRNQQLITADLEIKKSEDDDEQLCKEWRVYRKALRDWPANPNFPNKDGRPTAPN